MKNCITKLFSSLIFTLIVSCNITDEVVENIPLDEIRIKTKINYTYLGKSPSYKQSNILCKFDDELFILGTAQPILIYNLNDGIWKSESVPSNEYGRWDGAAIKHGEYIYYFGASITGVINDIVKYNPVTKIYEHTNLILPKYITYPAAGNYKDQFFFLNSLYDTIYAFSPTLNKINKITPNPFYLIDRSNIFCAGVYQDYFYVFANSFNIPRSNYFLRMNFLTNAWEELSIPSILQNKVVFGGAAGEKLIMFSDTTAAYTYSFKTKEWAIDKSIVPLFYKLSNGQIGATEWSFFSTDSCLYGSEVYSQKLWKISVK